MHNWVTTFRGETNHYKSKVECVKSIDALVGLDEILTLMKDGLQQQ